jgi:acetyl esterase/lipase
VRAIFLLAPRLGGVQKMSFAFDPEIELVMLAQGGVQIAPPPPGDWKALRESVEPIMAALRDATPSPLDVVSRDHEAVARDGSRIPLRWYAKQGSSGPAVLYVHGGGMILGSIELYDRVVAGYVAATGVPMLSVDYRLAPEHPHPTPVEDCFAALDWLIEHAASLGVDPARIAVMGDSAGGGLAAGVALLARDRGRSLARQVLVYPMLDDRNVTPDPALVPFAAWTYDFNLTGWTALLGDAVGGPAVPSSAAPARAADLRGVAPAYIEVGELDIFRDEDIDYARRIAAAGISVELHVHAGAPHGFERLAPASRVATRAMADRQRVLSSL